MEEEQDLNLVQDRFEDLSVDDQPLDLESDAGSFFDEDEIRSQIGEEEIATSIDRRQRQRPRHQLYEQLPTIKEANESKANISGSQAEHSRPNTANSKPIPKDDPWKSMNCPINLSRPIENESDDFSFKSGKAAMDEYEERFNSDKNLADRLFPEDNLRFKCNEPFEKENSWEPSIVMMERQPTPEFPDSEERRREISAPVFKNQNLKQSPEKSLMIGSPMSMNRTNIEAKTSTPKRPMNSRFGPRQKCPQLEISTISSIHAGSPTAAGKTFVKNSPVVDPSFSVTLPVTKSFLEKVITTSSKSEGLYDALERARSLRQNSSRTTFEMAAKKNSTIDKTAVSTRTALENSRQEKNRNMESQQNIFPPSSKSAVEARKLETRISRESQNNIFPPSSTTVASATEGRLSRDSQNMRSSSRASTASSLMSSASSSQKLDRAKRNPLQINGRRLAFGVIEVGDTIQLELEMENVSDRTCRAVCSIDSKSKSFEIVENRSSIIAPRQKTRIKVMFRPENAGRYQVMLMIAIPALDLQYKIPMWGCGGLAKIAPLVTNELMLSNTNDYILTTSNFSTITFKLKNSGLRDGFARIDVYDTMQRPINVQLRPARGIIIRRKTEKVVEIKFPETIPSLTAAASEDRGGGGRSGSAMSSVSQSSRKTSIGAGADVTIEIKWGEEMLRQRLKVLEQMTHSKIEIDGHDFTSMPTDENNEYNPQKGAPAIVPEDKQLFEASYRTTKILVYSTRSSRQFGYRSQSSCSFNPADTTVLETTAFRHQTFVRDFDATVMPSSSRK